MSSEWTALIWLLPLCAIISWWLGRRSVRQDSNGQQTRIHPDYFRGLNFVLNEQPDKAIEVFVKMLEVDSETVETHLALGNLFRRRGEVDRAIRIHQNLIARPNLSRDDRAIAMLELGIDYMRSGLFDRAESLFDELVQGGTHTSQAYRELLSIYQQEKDWDNAIITARRLEYAEAMSQHAVIAQFYCEKAEEMRARGDMTQARDNLRKAMNIDVNCARASMLDGSMQQQDGKLKQAIRAYKRVEKQDPGYFSEIIPAMQRCYRSMDKLEEFMEYLQGVVNRHGDITAVLTLAELIAEHDGEASAVRFLATELKKRPTVKGVDQLIQYTLSLAQGTTRESLISIKELTAKLLKNRSAYKCQQCGFDAKVLHWQCPSCKNWNTIKPVYGV